jgi:ankyrin repeat protein
MTFFLSLSLSQIGLAGHPDSPESEDFSNQNIKATRSRTRQSKKRIANQTLESNKRIKLRSPESPVSQESLPEDENHDTSDFSKSDERLVSKNVHPKFKEFIRAILRNDLENVRKFIENSPELLNGHDNQLWSPVHHAAFSGKVKILEELEKHLPIEKFMENPLPVTRRWHLHLVKIPLYLC